MAYSDYEHCSFCEQDRDAGGPGPHPGIKALHHMGSSWLRSGVVVICTMHLGALKAELADTIERAEKAEAERDEAVVALQVLYDEQNGPPLGRHAERWRSAMDAAEAVLAKAQDRDAAKDGTP